MITAVCLALTTLLLHLGGVRPAPLITSPWGQIQGTDGTSPGGAPYSVYRAIPYALPPLGERRFAKPVAHPGLGVGRVFNASVWGSVCPQKASEDLRDLMSEDCLTLNVYVPVSANTGPKTVMIWIHGGAFTVGSAYEYIPSELITTSDVIVVVIQYRLDVLGFLSSGDDVIPGNYGLWDQALGIKWVKDNIQAFGGDPNSITIFGESAGSACVGYQVLSPVSKGLNFRAIMQSGTPLSPWALKKNPSLTFNALANNTGCLISTSWADSMYYMVAGGRQRAEHEQILSCLREKDVATLLLAVNERPDSEIVIWAPTVDGDFVPRDPEDMTRDVNYLADVGATSRDVMTGVANDEGGFGLYFVYNSDQPLQEADLGRVLNVLEQVFVNDLVDKVLMFRDDEGLLKDVHRLETLVNVIQFFYTQSFDGGQVQRRVLDIFSDIHFVVPTVKFLRDLTKASDQLNSLGRPSAGRRYLYLFNHYPSSRAGLSQGNGLYHAEGLAYEFDREDYNGASYTFTTDDFSLASTFKSMITSFAKSGTPQLDVGLQAGGSWPEFSLAEEKYLSLEPAPRVDDYLYSERMAVWLDLVPSLLNSTRGINMGQQMYYPNGPNGYVTPMSMMQYPVNFVFKGYMKFFKLQ